MKIKAYSETAIRLAQASYVTVVFLDGQGTDDEGYVSLHPELDGCMSQGDSPQEAIENLADARLLYLESLLEDGLAVPEPKIASNFHLYLNMAELLGEEVESQATQALLLEHDILPYEA